MNKNLTIEEILQANSQKLDLVLKNQEAIMSHLWNYGSANDLDSREQQVIDYIENEITPRAEAAEKGEVGAEGVWLEMFINLVKKLALQLAAKALEHLLIKGAAWAVDGASFALERLQDFLYEKYQLANEEQKAIFKEKILAKFPDSGLANKLRNE